MHFEPSVYRYDLPAPPRWPSPAYPAPGFASSQAPQAPQWSTPATFSSSRAEQRTRRPPLVGEDPMVDPPHEADWWITTDNALEYAEWLGRRIEDFNVQLIAWTFPDVSTTAQEQLARAQAAAGFLERSNWPQWRRDWLAYLQTLREGWPWWSALGGPVGTVLADPRVNSWYTTRDKWHRQFREHVAAAQAAGGPGSKARLPVDPQQQPGMGLGLPSLPDTGKAVSDLGWGLGAVLVGVAAVLAARSLR